VDYVEDPAVVLSSICEGTAGIAGIVSCGDPALSCSSAVGCYYSYVDDNGVKHATACNPPPTPDNTSLIMCDGPNDCVSGEDCCSEITVAGESPFIETICEPRTTGGAAGSGCPVPDPGAPETVQVACNPTNPTATCPSGETCNGWNGTVFVCQ
jgi:hypothetical protein